MRFSAPRTFAAVINHQEQQDNVFESALLPHRPGQSEPVPVHREDEFRCQRISGRVPDDAVDSAVRAERGILLSVMAPCRYLIRRENVVAEKTGTLPAGLPSESPDSGNRRGAPVSNTVL